MGNWNKNIELKICLFVLLTDIGHKSSSSDWVQERVGNVCVIDANIAVGIGWKSNVIVKTTTAYKVNAFNDVSDGVKDKCISWICSFIFPEIREQNKKSVLV